MRQSRTTKKRRRPAGGGRRAWRVSDILFAVAVLLLLGLSVGALFNLLPWQLLSRSHASAPSSGSHSPRPSAAAAPVAASSAIFRTSITSSSSSSPSSLRNLLLVGSADLGAAMGSLHGAPPSLLRADHDAVAGEEETEETEKEEVAFCSNPERWARDDEQHLAWVQCSRHCLVEKDTPYYIYDDLSPNAQFEVCACSCMHSWQQHTWQPPEVVGHGDSVSGSGVTSVTAGGSSGGGSSSSSSSGGGGSSSSGGVGGGGGGGGGSTADAHPLSLQAMCPSEARMFSALLRDSTQLSKTFYVGGRSMPAWKTAAIAKGLRMVGGAAAGA
jgi:hypothetical protein